MKLKRLIITTSFILIATTASLSLTDARSKEITKIIIEENKKELDSELSIIAHRGFSSLEIENTKEAIEKGFATPTTTGVEIDVHLTKDNKVIVFHNDKVNNKKIEETTLEELQQETITTNNNNNLKLYFDSLLDDKSGNMIRERIKLLQDKKSKIISLKDALKIHESFPDKTLIIELKFDTRNPKTFYDEVYNLIKDHSYKNIIIQSDNYEYLTNMKKDYPYLEYHLIVKKDNYPYTTKYDLDGYVIRKNLVNHDDIKKLLENNKKVSIWTINNYYEFEEVNNELDDLRKKVHYITNYPDALRTWNNIKNSNNKQKIKK